MNDLNLEKFPLRLQKLALYISKSPEILSIPEYCREAGMSYDSIKQGISKSREKGNDFYEIVNHLAYQKFTSQKPKMYKALIEEGEKGNCKAIQIFFQLTGDLSPVKAEQSTTINSLTYVLAMPSTIENVLESPSPSNGHREEGEALVGMPGSDD